MTIPPRKRLSFIVLFAVFFYFTFTLSLSLVNSGSATTSFRSNARILDDDGDTSLGKPDVGEPVEPQDDTVQPNTNNTSNTTDTTPIPVPAPIPEPTPAAEPETSHGEHHSQYYPNQGKFWVFLGLAVFCVLTAGFCSGLTVGLLSIDDLQLELKMKTGTPEEKNYATIIAPIIAKHHQLLSTLLITNALAMECLPIFLDAIVPSWAAVLISTFFVVVFGEILPQAYCTGPQQLKIAAQTGPLVKGLMLVLSPICTPLAKFLDNYLGVHGKTRYVKNDLKALIELHQVQKGDRRKSVTEEDIAHTGLTLEETKLIVSTIDLRDTPVVGTMIKIETVYMLSSRTRITREIVNKVFNSGYSKIPVYKDDNKENVIGFIKAKSLLCYEKCIDKTVQESGLPLIDPLYVSKDTSMLALLGLFQVKKTGIALITEDSVKKERPDDIFFSKRDYVLEPISRKKLIGLISLKDILEEMLESELKDDDIHNPISMYSMDPSKKKKVRGMGSNEPVEEEDEPAEDTGRGLRRPLLK